MIAQKNQLFRGSLTCLVFAFLAAWTQDSAASAQERSRLDVGDFGATNYQFEPVMESRVLVDQHLTMLMKQKAYKQALRVLELAFKSPPNKVESFTKLINLHVRYGNQLGEKGYLTLAIRHYCDAIELNQMVIMALVPSLVSRPLP